MGLFQKNFRIHTTHRGRVQENEQIETQKISQISEAARRMNKSKIKYAYMESSVRCYKKRHPISMV